MRDYNLSNEKIAELEKLHRSLCDKQQADRVKGGQALLIWHQYRSKAKA